VPVLVFGLPKSRAAKVNEFYTNPLLKAIFSVFLANYGRKMKKPAFFIGF
jgi:hypothetical protein